jgi:hypothetical protein
MTSQQINKGISRESKKTLTDERTWNFVQKFWTVEEDQTEETLREIQVLELRMEWDHGWTR